MELAAVHYLSGFNGYDLLLAITLFSMGCYAIRGEYLLYKRR